MKPHDFLNASQLHFNALCDDLLSKISEAENVTLNLSAESSLFIRFNGNRVRQNTDVTQWVFSIRMQANGRTVENCRSLGGQAVQDQTLVQTMLQQCRAEIAVLPLDPNQVPISDNGTSVEIFRGNLPNAEDLVQTITQTAQGCDLAGLYAGGAIVRGNRNSKGQSHWFASETFFVDYSLYSGTKAAKGVYAGAQWSPQELFANIQRTKSLLLLLDKPQQCVTPGSYRTYLAPKAFSDLVGLLGWNALSASAWKQGRCPFKMLADKESRLSPLLHIAENFGLGLTPRFNDMGEVSETRLPLIEKGELRQMLVSSRTAKEYALQANGASENEAPRALDVQPGDLAETQVLQALGTGLYLSNLHYLNWSDPVSARVTGMTRYACFWVQGGEIVGPIQNMRWDESLYSALGDKLMALTSHTEIDPAVETYFQRSLGGARTPGALIDQFTFTL